MLRIELDSAQFTRALNELHERTRNLEPALDEIGAHIESEIDLLFRAAQAPDGTPWDPLKHRIGKPLNDTGVLKNSITHNADAHRVEIGTNVEYAITHQKGARKGQYAPRVPWGDIPARPFIPEDSLPADWASAVLDIIGAHLES
ncbi:MAG: phage virion morphogenesis protein [Methyloprofundus sp.]|nr:phage virion morphogenesis protein [Methyloprofundus sp.]